MITKKKFEAINLILIYLFIGIMIILGYPNEVSTVLKYNYIVDTIGYFFTSAIFIFVFIKHRMDILDPIVFISFIYISMFFITPIIDIKIGKILFFGVDLFEYGIKGSIIAIIGYFSFFIGYIIPIKNKIKLKIEDNNKYLFNKEKIIFITMILWTISFLISLISIIYTSGNSILYVLTLGILGSANTVDISSTPLGAISMFCYVLVPTCLIYSNYSESKIKSLMIFGLTSIIHIVRGFRFILIILLLSHIYLYYLKSKKRPSIKMVMITVAVMVIIVGVVGFSRDAIRFGGNIDWKNFNFEVIYEIILDNFRIYNVYYAVIKSVPEIIPHLYGGQMFIYTLVMFIPRAIYPNKPMPKVNDPIVVGISEYASKAGQAYPGIGEYYYDFGITGVILFMWFFGYCMRLIRMKYILNDTDDFGLIIYSIIIPTTFQLLIRGYTPSNFYLLIFLIIPVIIIKKIVKEIS